MNDLAIFGNTPLFTEALHVGRPNTVDNDLLLKRVKKILSSGWLTNQGPMVNEFEETVKNYLKVRNFIALSSGTTALEIAIKALDLKDEVIVPSFTFAAIPHVLKWLGIEPVFADIDKETLNIDPSSIEKYITSKTTGIIGVHTWGRICDVEKIDLLAEEYNLKVIYDSSHSFSLESNGVKTGNFGDIETFSFHATKFINSFEGGAICTNDDEIANKVRLMKNFGFAGMDNVTMAGINGKMSEVSAAMGLTAFECMEDIRAINKRNYNLYKERLSGISWLTLMEFDHESNPNYQYITVEVNDAFPLKRDEIVTILHNENVIARRYFYPGCHRMEPYYEANQEKVLPVTEEKVNSLICLPTGNTIGEYEINKLCDIFEFIERNDVVIRNKLKTISDVNFYQLGLEADG